MRDGMFISWKQKPDRWTQPSPEREIQNSGAKTRVLNETEAATEAQLDMAMLGWFASVLLMFNESLLKRVWFINVAFISLCYKNA